MKTKTIVVVIYIIFLAIICPCSSRKAGKRQKQHENQEVQREDQIELSKQNTSSTTEMKSPTRFAICLTGQLARLELGSKIHNLLNTNLRKGYHLGLFVILDNDLGSIKAVKDKSRFTAEKALYANFTAGGLVKLIRDQTIQTNHTNNFESYVRLEKPKVQKFTILNSQKVPVYGRGKEWYGGPEIAIDRFQNHMRWQAGLRECVRWIQDIEITKRKHYDFVMRLREDTYVFDQFYFYPFGYLNKLISLDMNGWGGINDHNLIIDRLHVDRMFRGFAEDYYFQEGDFSSHGDFWGTPEQLIEKMAKFYKIDVVLKPICLFPFVTIHSRKNDTLFSLKAFSNLNILKRFTTTCRTNGKKVNITSDTAPLLDPDFSLANGRLSALSTVNNSAFNESLNLIKPSITETLDGGIAYQLSPKPKPKKGRKIKSRPK